MRFRILVFAALLFLGPLTGCIEFERQTVTYSYDTSTDTLRIYQDYNGIFGGDNRQGLSREELNQLDSVLGSQRTFFFANWISEISHEQLRDKLKEIRTAEYQKEQKLEPAAREHLEVLIKRLIEDVHIENGPFYQDKEGKLSGVQRVTINKASQLINAGNVCIRDAFKAEASDEKAKPEEKRLYLKSIGRQQDYIKIEGNRITVSFPATKDQIEENTNGSEKTRAAIEAFRKAGGTLTFTNDEVMVTFGKPSDKLTSLTLSVSDETYSTNLVETIKSRSLLKADLDRRADAARFFGAGR
jgi:hypothetical protein